MRVIAGSAGSLRLQYPRGADIRPTTDVVREALFASLGDRVCEARFADLYAGSGSVGIEALSRGAQTCVFVEKDPRCVQALAANLEHTRLRERGTVVRGGVERMWSATARRHGPFDIVFADPPYELSGFGQIVRRLTGEWEGVALDGLVVLQYRAGHGPGEVPAGGRVKRFGETELGFYERRRFGTE